MKPTKWTQGIMEFGKVNEVISEEEADYRTRLISGMTPEEKREEFLKWRDSLPDKEDFIKALGN